ncbi:MAG: AAA family ATPase [Bacteroidetes bacterium]|nr:MAG: AAA family ATPase [Bacteroidota bacterium]
MNKKPLELNADFKYALDLLEKSNKSLFLTGRAGTGKSTFLRLFRKTTRKKMIVLAPTGIAALNVGGQTIHSFCGFPPRFLRSQDIKKSRRYHKLIKKLDVCVIDEISMVRADLLDAINLFFQKNRESYLPFGGIQMVFIGDLFQLPPIIASDVEQQYFEFNYQTPYFFSAHVLHAGFDIEMMELRKVYRQEQRHFLRLLDAVRLNRIDWEDLEDLNERYIPDFKPKDFYITLSPRNYKVDQINNRELAKLPGPSEVYFAKIKGQFDPRQYPTRAELELKVGAQVMFIRNDPENGAYVNGTLGKVVELHPDKVRVLIDDHGRKEEIDVEPVEWEILKYKLAGSAGSEEIDTEVVGTFSQLPLRLAWAVTIHKSQGKTFDRVIIDMGKGAFEHGQTYVALSRCRSLEGIVLKQKIQMRDIMVDERIVEFYEQYF